MALNVDQAFFTVPGGTGTYVRELVGALPAADPEIRLSLFHARFRGATPPAWMRAFPRHELAQTIRTLYPTWALAGVPRLPPSVASADVVHATSPVAVPPVGEGRALVVTVHDLAFRVLPTMFPPTWRTLFRLGLRRAAARADAIVAVSRHTADDVVRHAGVPSERVHVVPLAASLPPSPASPDEALRRLAVPRPYALFVGTLEPRKNVVRLVRAYRRAVGRASLPHALVLAGPLGWRSEPLHRELARGGPGRVVLVGRVAEADLDALYRGAEAFVYPSLYEGFGLPVLEAMARGVPTIATRSSSVPEVTGDAAILVDPGSTAEIESAIVSVLSDRRERTRLSAAGIERARLFSWERTARATAAVYRAVS